MAKYVAIKPDGTREEWNEPKGKLNLDTVKQLIGNGCDCVERIKVRYEGKARDCWLDESGLLKARQAFNPKVKALAQDYWNRPMQDFVGVGVVWIPGK